MLIAEFSAVQNITQCYLPGFLLPVDHTGKAGTTTARLLLRVLPALAAVLRFNMGDSTKIVVYKSGPDLEKGVQELLKRVAKEAIDARGKFLLGVSG